MPDLQPLAHDHEAEARMGYRIAAFEAVHIERLSVQRFQRASLNPDRHWERLVCTGYAWTMLRGNQPIFCGGIVPIWHGRAEAWTMVGTDVKARGMRMIHQVAMRYLDMAQQSEAFRRIEATTPVRFAKGVRWLKLLGFDCEGIMRQYSPEGEDVFLFARVR